jgi:hypothetical protein
VEIHHQSSGSGMKGSSMGLEHHGAAALRAPNAAINAHQNDDKKRMQSMEKRYLIVKIRIMSSYLTNQMDREFTTRILTPAQLLRFFSVNLSFPEGK